jgi:hypothetical protein
VRIGIDVWDVGKAAANCLQMEYTIELIIAESQEVKGNFVADAKPENQN